MPGETLNLACPKPEAWRNIVCSCTNCDSYDCFALRHESAAGCTCAVCEHSKTCLFYNKVKANLNAPQVITSQVKTPQVKKTSQVKISQEKTSQEKTPRTFSYQDTGTPIATPKCNIPSHHGHHHTEECSTKFCQDCNTLFYENIKARLEEVQATVKDIKCHQESVSVDVPASQVPPIKTLKSPPKATPTPQPSPETLPKASPGTPLQPAQSSDKPPQIKGKTTPGNTIIKLESLNACPCKIAKTCPYYKKDKQQLPNEPGQAATNKTCSSYHHTPMKMSSKNKTGSSETIKSKTYRVVPIVDSDHTDYIKVDSTETYNNDKSNVIAPKTEHDSKHKHTHRSDRFVLSDSEMKRCEKIIKVLKYILEQNEEKGQYEKQQVDINKDKIDKKHTSKKSKVDEVSNANLETNINLNNISDKTKDNSKNINIDIVQKAIKTYKNENDIIDNSNYAVDSSNISKLEKITNDYPDYEIKNTSSKCKNKFCTLVDEKHKPFKKRIELQIIYDIRGNEMFSNKSDEIQIKPSQNISYPCSHTKTSAELSAQIMNVPFREYTQYIQNQTPKPEPQSASKEKGSKYLLKKIKDIYEACSCKVCECISSVVPSNVPTNKSEVCNCKPCDCDECRGYGKGSKKAVLDTPQRIKSEECDCKPCECIECKSSKLSDSCACKDCECIECKYSNIKKYRKYIVAPVGENPQRRYCDCSPCGCFECAHPYGTVSNRITQETSTEVHRRHLNCNCHPCNNVDCEQDGEDTCTCDRHSKVMSKPVLKDTQEYDIHHVTVSNIGRNAYKCKKTDKSAAAWLFSTTPKKGSFEDITNVADALCARFSCKKTETYVLPSAFQSKSIHKRDGERLFSAESNEQSSHYSNVKVIEPVSTRFGSKEVISDSTPTKQDEASEHLKFNDNIDSRGCGSTCDDNVNELNNGEYESQKIDKNDTAWLFSAVHKENSNNDDNSNKSHELCGRFGCDDTVAVALNLTHNFPTAKYFATVKKSNVCDCKPCECLKCLKHYKEGHNPKERTRNCYCEICDCINCESMLCDTSVCDCKPCDCRECRKYLPPTLRNYDCRSSEYTSTNKKVVYPCTNDSNSRYLTLLKAKESDRFLDKIITDRETKNRSQVNNLYNSYTEPSHQTNPQVDMYCEISNNNKYNRSHKDINEELLVDRANPNVIKDKIHEYVSKKSNTSRVNETTKKSCYKEKKTTMKSKNDESITRDSSWSLEPSSSALAHVKESLSITRSDRNHRNTKSRESSCNSSGHDNSNYLIRFPKSTVETCISDVMNLDHYKKSAFTPSKAQKPNPENEYKTSAISGYLHNTLVLKNKYSSLNHDTSKQSVIKISNLKMCENFNSESPCNCQPCDCDKCTYKTIKYDRCRCDCSGCFCYGTCLSEDKSVCIRKNELTQTLELIENGEVSWESNRTVNPETKTLVNQFYPAWNTQELEVSRDKDIQSKKSDQIFMNKNSTDIKLYKNDNCVLNSCVTNINYYDSVQHTLRDAKAFSLELLKILQKYEKANRDFDSISKKFKDLQVTRLHDNVVVEKEESNNSEVTEEKQPVKNSSEAQFHIYSDSTHKIEALESITEISLKTVPINISNNFVDDKNERNKILTDIYDLNRPEIVPLITSEDQNHEQEESNMNTTLTPFKDENHVQENSDMKVKLDDLKSQYKMYSKLISRAIIKCRKDKWKKTCGSGSHSKFASRDNSRNYDNLIQNNVHDENVSLLSKETKDKTKNESNHKLNTVYVNTVDPRDLDSVSTDKTLDFDNNQVNLFPNFKKELFSDKEQLATSNSKENVSDPNLALEKEDALIDIPASFNTYESMDCVSQDEKLYQKMSFSKGYHNIMSKDIEEASTSRDETLRAEFQRRFESMPSVPQKKRSLLTDIDNSIEKIASSNIVKTTSSYDPKKVAFQTVRKLSDHTILVKWKVPLITTDIEGYELLLNGRSVQKVLSPTHNMAVVTCLPHTNKVLLTVRTITLTSVTTGHYPATTVVYRLRSK